MFEFDPDWYVPTKDSILECMRVRNLSEDEFAQLMHLSPDFCQKLLHGDEPVTPSIAQRLSEVVGGTQRFWIALEKQYREDKLRLENQK